MGKLGQRLQARDSASGPDERTPIHDKDGRLISCDLERNLAAVELRAADWVSRGVEVEALVDEELMALLDGDGDDLLRYCLKTYPEAILDERSARWQAIGRASPGRRGSLCNDPWSFQ